MKKLAVIVPCYNEELVISESYRRTKEALQSVPIATEIIYITMEAGIKPGNCWMV